MNRRSYSRAERFAARLLERLPVRSFRMTNGLRATYDPKREHLMISGERGSVVDFSEVDVSLLRRLLDAGGEWREPTHDRRYRQELESIRK